jgi:hypothetical protein
VREFAEWLQATPVSVSIQSMSGWIIPLLQSIHIVMIGVVFVSSLVITLRVLGRMRADEPFVVVWNRFAPWMWIGLVVMALTGLTLVVAEPVREFTALSFWLKMALIAVAVASILLFGRSLEPGMRRAPSAPGTMAAGGTLPAAGQEFSPGKKAVAVATVVLWVAIIFLGRAIAYDVEVWGSWSLHA